MRRYFLLIFLSCLKMIFELFLFLIWIILFMTVISIVGKHPHHFDKGIPRTALSSKHYHPFKNRIKPALTPFLTNSELISNQGWVWKSKLAIEVSRNIKKTSSGMIWLTRGNKGIIETINIKDSRHTGGAQSSPRNLSRLCCSVQAQLDFLYRCFPAGFWEGQGWSWFFTEIHRHSNKTWDDWGQLEANSRI